MTDVVKRCGSLLAKNNFQGAYDALKGLVASGSGASPSAESLASAVKLTTYLTKKWARGQVGGWNAVARDEWTKFRLGLLRAACEKGVAVGLPDFVYAESKCWHGRMEDEATLIAFYIEAWECLIGSPSKRSGSSGGGSGDGDGSRWFDIFSRAVASAGEEGGTSAGAENSARGANTCGSNGGGGGGARSSLVGRADMRVMCAWAEHFAKLLTKSKEWSKEVAKEAADAALARVRLSGTVRDKWLTKTLYEQAFVLFGFDRKRGRDPQDTFLHKDPLLCVLESQLHARFGRMCVQLGALQEKKDQDQEKWLRNKEQWRERAEGHFRAFLWLGKRVSCGSGSDGIKDANLHANAIIGWLRPVQECAAHFADRLHEGGEWPKRATECALLLAEAEERGLELAPRSFQVANVHHQLRVAIEAGVVECQAMGAAELAGIRGQTALARRARALEKLTHWVREQAPGPERALLQLNIGKLRGLIAFEKPNPAENAVPMFEEAYRDWDEWLEEDEKADGLGEQALKAVARAPAVLHLMAVMCKIWGQREMEQHLLKLRASTVAHFGDTVPAVPTLSAQDAHADVALALVEEGRGEDADAYMMDAVSAHEEVRADVEVGARPMRPIAAGCTVLSELEDCTSTLQRNREGCSRADLALRLSAQSSRLQLRSGDPQGDALPEMQKTVSLALHLLLGASMSAGTDVEVAPDYSELSDDEAMVQKQQDVQQKRIFREALGHAPPSLLAALQNMSQNASMHFTNRLRRVPMLHEALYELGTLWDLRGVPRLALWCARTSRELASSLGAGENALVERSERLISMIERKKQPLLSAFEGGGGATAASLEGLQYHEDTANHLMQKGLALLSASKFKEAVRHFDDALAEIKRACEDEGADDQPRQPPAPSAKGRVVAPYAELRATLQSQKARALGMMGNFDKAIKVFETSTVETENGLSPLCRATALYNWGTTIVDQLQHHGALNQRWSMAMLSGSEGADASKDARRAFELLTLSWQLLSTLNAPRLHSRVCTALSVLCGRTQQALATFFANQSIGGTVLATIEQVAKEGNEPNAWHQKVSRHRYCPAGFDRGEWQDGGEWQTMQIEKHLPRHWTIVSVSFGLSRSEFLLTRLHHDAEPVIIRLPMHGRGASLIADFEGLVEENKSSLTGYSDDDVATWTNKEKMKWKKNRDALDKKFRDCVADMETLWLRHWKCIMCGDIVGDIDEGALNALVDKTVANLSDIAGAKVDGELLCQIISGMDVLNDAEVAEALRELVSSSGGADAGAAPISSDAVDLSMGGIALEKLTVAKLKKALEERGHSINGLKKKKDFIEKLRSVLESEGGGAASADASSPVDSFDFEKKAKELRTEVEMIGPSKRGTLKRHPIVLVLGEGLQHVPWESFGVLECQPVTRMPSLDLVLAHAEDRRAPELTVADMRFVLNPNSDLPKMQKNIEPVLERVDGKCIGAGPGHRPTAEQWRAALSEADLFVFCGHNSGEAFCYRHTISRLPKCAAALLMGCNSARTDSEGQYEGQGYISAFLTAGCPAVVGNLWEVGCSDTDRFTKDLLMSCHGNNNQLESVVAAVRNSTVRDAEGRDEYFIRNATTRFAVVHYGVPIEIRWPEEVDAAPPTKLNFSEQRKAD